MHCKCCGYDMRAGSGPCPRCHTPPGVPGGGKTASRPRRHEVLAERFVLERRLGAGGLGEVWLAHDSMLDDAPVACKILRSVYFHDRRAIADLKREVLLARRLRHPNILGVHTFWETTAHRFVVMEYVEGQNLSDALHKHGRPFTLNQVLPWLAQLCAALDYAHAEGVLHRDIKPANFLLDGHGTIRLADFGIARTLKEIAKAAAGEITCGTLLFMSPEQLAGKPLDARSDLYSLAASTYELLAGEPPFYPDSLVEPNRAASPLPILHLGAAVNQALMAGLAKDRELRPARCGHFCTCLEQAARSESEAAREPAPVVPRHRHEDETVELPAVLTVNNAGRLGTLLLEAGVISQEQLDEACALQESSHKRLGEVLDALGYAGERDVARALAHQLRLPYTEWLDEADIEYDVVHLISEGAARHTQCVPMRWKNGQLVVVMADPFDLDTINALEASVRARLDTIVAPPSVIAAALDRVFASQP